MSKYEALAPVYDSMTRNVDYERRCEWIDRMLKQDTKKGIVLDAGCGTGTLALLLEKKGYDVIGVDASTAMLGEAYAKSSELGSSIQWICQDLRSLDLYGTVRAVVCMQDTVNHLPPSDLNTVFSRFSLFTEPDGWLIFDHNTEYKHREILSDRSFVIEDAQSVCVWQNQYDEARCSVQLTVDVFRREGDLFRRTTDHFWEYTYSDQEIQEVLENTGYKIMEKLDGENYGPVSPHSERIIICARKKT